MAHDGAEGPVRAGASDWAPRDLPDVVADDAIYPYTPWRMAWEVCMWVLTLTGLWEASFAWFMAVFCNGGWVALQLAVDVFFACDLAIVRRTGYVNRGVIVVDLKKAASRQRPWRLVVGILYSVPVYLAGLTIRNRWGRAAIVSVRLLRGLRMWEAFQCIRRCLLYQTTVVKLVSYGALVATGVHLVVCILWFESDLASRQGKPEFLMNRERQMGIWSQYFRLVLFVSVTLLTVGYGDVVPRNLVEVVIVIVIECVGCVMYQHAIASLVAAISVPTRGTFISRFRRLYRALKWRDLSSGADLLPTLHFYEYQWKTDRRREDFEADVKVALPPQLQWRVKLALYLREVRAMPWAIDVQEEVLMHIAAGVYVRVIPPRERLFHPGEDKVVMWVRGLVSVNGRRVPAPASASSRGRCPLGCVADTYVEVLELQVNALARVRELVPNFDERVELDLVPNVPVEGVPEEAE